MKTIARGVVGGEKMKSLVDVIKAKSQEIERNTDALLDLGFPFDGRRFSLSPAAWQNMTTVLLLASNMPFPMAWSDICNGEYSIKDAAALQQFYGAMAQYGATVKASAVKIRASLQAIIDGEGTDAEKISAIESLKDNRV